jgi:hypothetical protein
MSAQAFSWVCQHSDAQGTERLVLLVLANYAGDLITQTGETYFECWPGVARIAEDARLDSTRSVQNALTRLAKSGQIERVINGAPDERMRSDRRPNLYRIHTRPRPLRRQIGQRFTVDEIARHPALQNRTMPVDNSGNGVSSHDRPSSRRGVVSRRDGVSSDDATGCRETTPKPLEEPLEEPRFLRDARATAAEPVVENPEAHAADGQAVAEHSHPLAQRAATAAERLARDTAEVAEPVGGRR